MGKSIVIILIIVLVGAGAYFALQQNAAPQTAPAAPQAVSTPPQPQAPRPMTGIPVIGGTTTPETQHLSSVEAFTVTGANYSFSPSEIKVKKGDTVKITFKNSGGFHSFHLDEFNIATEQLETGSQQTVQFIADKAGSFEYYCSVGQHRAMGMKGTLIVE